MSLAFAGAAAVAVAATAMAITRTNAVHALLYLAVSLLAVALVFFLLGAPFVAALEVIVYAGAIVVLFVFVVMLLSQGESERQAMQTWLRPRHWVGPSLLAAVLLAEVAAVIVGVPGTAPAEAVSAKRVGIALYGPWLVAVEAASFLLLAGLVGAWHLGRRRS